MAVPVIFDTDAGSDIDDLYALALILRHPNLDLLAVSTVAGDTQARARLVAKMLRLAGRSDVPVVAGRPSPAGRAEGRTEAVLPASPLTHADLVQAGDPEAGAEYGEAIGFILDTLASEKRTVTFIGTGPWTNLARVLELADDTQRSRIGCLSLMGGEVHQLHAEWNVKSDPEAAELVLRSRLPIFLATWSPCRALRFTMRECAALFGSDQSPFRQALGEGTRLWWGAGQPDKPGPVCYDVVPVFWAAGEREGISCIRLDAVAVERVGRYTRGMTVAPVMRVLQAPTADGTSSDGLTVTASLDAALLKRRYLELVFGRTSGSCAEASLGAR